MRYGIFSDIHSNLEALDAVLEAYKKEHIERYLCAGDVVGYAANPIECINKLRLLPVITIAGNHDWAAVDLFSTDYFNPQAAGGIFWTKQKLNDKDRGFLEQLELLYKNEDLTLVHGTLDNPADFDYMADSYTAQRSFELLENNICFIGHSHVVGIFIMDKDGYVNYTEKDSLKIKEGNRYIVNVGSVGQPRDNNPKAAYCVYDTKEKEVQIKRIDYDIEAARRKIIDAGLPKSLGDRLLVGR